MQTRLISQPTRIEAPGYPPKEILEYIGRVNSGTPEVSVAMLTSPPGWEEPGQTPRFNEYTVVLKGALHVRLRDCEIVVEAGQAIIAVAGEWVQYHTPGGAEYFAVCLPAFSADEVQRDGG